MAAAVRYLIFDIESVADRDLIKRLRYADEPIDATEALGRYRAELEEKYESDFVPYTYQVPVSVAVAKVTADFRLADVTLLDEPEFRPHVITENFWRGWEMYRRPTLVSFNGRSFDLPVLELAAFRYGISVPGWFDSSARHFEQRRNRYNVESHLDLLELLTNFGTSRFTGGLYLAANLIGKPGKMEVQAHKIQDLYDAGRLDEINDNCRYDVLDTYFVFLRTRVLVGQISLGQEQELIAEARQWLTVQADGNDAYRLYLEKWGNWPNPWAKVGAAEEGEG